MKRRILLAALSTALPLAVSAQQIAVTVNSQPVHFASGGPRSIDGRVLVPLRGVFEALGAYVEWVPSRRTVIANKGDVDLELRIGNRIARVNGRDVLLDVPAVVYGGSTMVPLRFVGETLGAEVDWNAMNRTVEITTTDAGRVTDPINPPPRGNMPEITGFTVNSDGWVRGNQSLEVVLTGTPGGRASFEIPGVTTSAVTMREQSPGRYVGTWRPADASASITGASVLGRLEVNGRERMIQAGRNLSIDMTPPKIRNIIPDRSQVSNPRPTIAVVFDDGGGSGIDEDSVVLIVNGEDVSRRAEVTGGFVNYQPPRNLPAGVNRVELRAADKAGNQVSGAWTFTIADAAQIIRGLTHNGDGRLEPGDVFTVRLLGEAGGRATFSIGSIVSDRTMRETEPGIYVGEYTVRKGDRFDNAPVSATLTTASGQTYTTESQQRLALNAGVASAPRITSPAADATIRGPLSVFGTAERNSRIRVRVEYVGNALGILRVSGAVFDRILETDDQGRWTTGDIPVGNVAGASGTTYTIRATPIDAQGNEGREVVVRASRA